MRPGGSRHDRDGWSTRWLARTTGVARGVRSAARGGLRWSGVGETALLPIALAPTEITARLLRSLRGGLATWLWCGCIATRASTRSIGRVSTRALGEVVPREPAVQAGAFGRRIVGPKEWVLGWLYKVSWEDASSQPTKTSLGKVIKEEHRDEINATPGFIRWVTHYNPWLRRGPELICKGLVEGCDVPRNKSCAEPHLVGPCCRRRPDDIAVNTVDLGSEAP